MNTKTVTVPNITCGHCVKTIEREVSEIPGVVAVEAEEASKRVTVSWNESETSWNAVASLLAEIDYPPQTP